LFKFRCNIFIDVRIIKEMPGSLASGTNYTLFITVVITAGDGVFTHISLLKEKNRVPNFQQKYFPLIFKEFVNFAVTEYSSINNMRKVVHFIILSRFSSTSFPISCTDL